MGGFCRWSLVIFAVLYLLALALLAIGNFGLFGSERDPLSAAYLVLLGMPWTLLLGGLPEPLLPWSGALAPAINLLLIGALCRWRATARRRP